MVIEEDIIGMKFDYNDLCILEIIDMNETHVKVDAYYTTSGLSEEFYIDNDLLIKMDNFYEKYRKYKISKII